MRTIWKGAINFGLVNIPIKLKTATTKKNISFRNLHAKCNTPVKMKRYCPTCEEEVSYDEIVKGYEYEKNKFVILDDEDFDNIPVKSTRTIDIVNFVKLNQIDPIYYIKTYYLEPAKGGEKPYLLLKNSLDSTDKVAISRITIRSKESLAVIRVMEETLALETMFFAEEVRSPEELPIKDIENKIQIKPDEEKLAVEIINNLTDEFEPEKYENQYKEELMQIIRNKIEGEEVEVPDIEEQDRKVIDLMEKLKASVEASEKREEQKKRDKKKETVTG
ncbi:MAG: Ku protein [Bacillota bacterium]